MAFRKFALILPVAALVAGCQSDKKTAREQELEQRVQTLEQQLAATASPSPEASASAEGLAFQQPDVQAPQAAPAPVVRSQTPRSTTASRAPVSRQSGSTRRADVRSEPQSRDRYDGPSAEPVDDDDDGVEAVRPRATSLVLPEGTELHLILEEGLSSATSRVGETVTARVESAMGDDGRIVLPGGSVLQGRVTDVRSSGRVSGRARLAVDFDRIVVRGRTHELDATQIMAEAPSQSGRDAKIVGGSAAAGAILGAIADGKKGAVRGAVVGAGAGGAAVLITKGREIELPAGSRWTVRVRNPVRL
jgi:type IV secretory pathway VirB10-like protein